jgi:hypothetical protein
MLWDKGTTFFSDLKEIFVPLRRLLKKIYDVIFKKFADKLGQPACERLVGLSALRNAS